MFTATRKFRFSKRIHTPHHVALAFIQQPVNLIDLSPVVTNKVASEDDPNFYVITDKLTFLGISFDTTYTARFTLREGGLDAACHAAGGVELFSYWRANVVASEGRDGDEGEGTAVTEVVEDVTVKVSGALWFILYSSTLLIEIEFAFIYYTSWSLVNAPLRHDQYLNISSESGEYLSPSVHSLRPDKGSYHDDGEAGREVGKKDRQ